MVSAAIFVFSFSSSVVYCLKSNQITVNAVCDSINQHGAIQFIFPDKNVLCRAKNGSDVSKVF